MLTPDTAHGTNPATVTMAGYEVVKVATDERGGVDLDDLRAKADEDVACLMLTNPNTLGLFDENIARDRTDRPRGRRDPLLRRRQPERDHGPLPAGRHGLRHRPRQPPQVVLPAARRRRARAPGRSPSPSGSSPFLPVPRIVRGEGGERRRPRASTSTTSAPKSIGRCAASRATSASSSAPTPTSSASAATACAEASETAVLNANYLMARLREGPRRQVPAARLRAHLHARVRPLGRARRKRELGVKTLDIAKRLLDFGFHPPTIYFPLLVDEALMIEPTETETRESLDGFADAIEQILAEAEADPEIARNAPYTTPVRRLDEAAREPQAGRPPAARAERQSLAAVGLRQLLLSARARARTGRRALDALERRRRPRSGAAPGRRRLGERLDLVPVQRGRDGRRARGRAASRRRPSSSRGRSGSSRRRPCPCAASSSSSR